MKRLVGLASTSKKEKAASKPQVLNDIVKSTDDKVVEIDRKIDQCDAELRKINNQMKTSVPGISKVSLREKAKSILVRKKRYEQQVEQLRDKSFNMDSLAMSITAADDTIKIATVMQTGAKQLKKQLDKIDVDSIEETQDDIADLIEMTDEIQAACSKNYDVPQDIDDDELNNQLESLGDEIIADNDPSYIDAVLQPNAVPLTRKPSSKNRRGGGPPGSPLVEVDDFGLPILPDNAPEEKVTTTTKENDLASNHVKK